MKKYILILLSSLLLTSCINAEITENINNDGIANITMKMDISKLNTIMEEQAKQSGSGAIKMTQSKPCEKNDTQLTNYKCTLIDKDHYTIEGTLDLSQSGVFHSQNGIYILNISQSMIGLEKEKTNTIYKEKTQESIKQEKQMYAMMGMEIYSNIKMPGKLAKYEIGALSGEYLRINYADLISVDNLYIVSTENNTSEEEINTFLNKIKAEDKEKEKKKIEESKNKVSQNTKTNISTGSNIKTNGNLIIEKIEANILKKYTTLKKGSYGVGGSSKKYSGNIDFNSSNKQSSIIVNFIYSENLDDALNELEKNWKVNKEAFLNTSTYTIGKKEIVKPNLFYYTISSNINKAHTQAFTSRDGNIVINITASSDIEKSYMSELLYFTKDIVLGQLNNKVELNTRDTTTNNSTDTNIETKNQYKKQAILAQVKLKKAKKEKLITQVDSVITKVKSDKLKGVLSKIQKMKKKNEVLEYLEAKIYLELNK